jgi:hypothetical protein
MRQFFGRDLMLAMLGFAFGSALIATSAGTIVGGEEIAVDRSAQHLI